jgi:hypothetical protein
MRLNDPRMPLLPRRNNYNRKATMPPLSMENVSWELVNERLDYLPLPIKTSPSQRKLTMRILPRLVASARKMFPLRRGRKKRMLRWCKRWQRQHGYICRERQLPSNRMPLWRKMAMMMMMMPWKNTRLLIPIRNPLIHLFQNPSIYFPIPLQNRRIWGQQWRGKRGRFTTSYPRVQMHPPRPPRRCPLQLTYRRHMIMKLLPPSKRRRKKKR